MQTFYDLVKHRKSIRKYLPKAIEPEKIELITKVALMAPASKRSNPWEFLVIQDPEMLKQLSTGRPHGSQLIANAPLAIVVVADTTKSDVWIEDASITSIMIQLAARELDLGSCWVQVRGREHENGISTDSFIRELLNIPDKYAVLNVIAIGYPDEERKPFDEEKLAYDKIHYEKF